jgi:hypothetical protein
MMMLIDLAEGFDHDDDKFRKLWDRLTPRIQPVGLKIEEIKRLIGKIRGQTTLLDH